MSTTGKDRLGNEYYVEPEIRLRNRRMALEKRLADVSLSEFKVGQFMDICLVHDEKSVWNARSTDLMAALTRLEKFLDERDALNASSSTG
jgi:hypothetical protein